MLMLMPSQLNPESLGLVRRPLGLFLSAIILFLFSAESRLASFPGLGTRLSQDALKIIL